MWQRILFEEVGKAFVFKRIRQNLKFHFSKAGKSEVPYELFGILFWLTVVCTAVLYLTRVYPWLISLRLSPIEFFFGVFLSWLVIHGIIVALTILGIYVYFDFVIHSRMADMEEQLQPYLEFVSENLKGGMSFERALWSAVRPQFGVLAEEMKLAAKKVMTGQDVEEALKEFTTKYTSPILKRNFDLIVEGTKGGGQIAEIIDRVTENLEDLKELKGEIRATNLTYLIFLGVVVVVVAPLLFALSFQFLSILNAFSSRLDFASQGGVQGLNSPFGFGQASIDLGTFRNFSMAALMVIAVFSSLIVSIIQQGNVRASVKYLPLFVGGSLIFYLIFVSAGSLVFGGLLS